MPISVKPSKKRRIKTSPAARQARKDYKIKMKNPTVKKAAAKKAKVYYKRNKVALKRKAAATRKARKK